MFIFSIIPLHLYAGSYNYANSTSNGSDIFERITYLEALVTGWALRQDIGYLGGFQYGYEEARYELNFLRTQGLATAQENGEIPDYADERLQTIKNSEYLAYIRTNDLNMVYNNLVNGTPLPYWVSGIDNTSLASVQAEQSRTSIFTNEVIEADAFWSQLVGFRNQNTNDTTQTPTSSTPSSEGTTTARKSASYSTINTTNESETINDSSESSNPTVSYTEKDEELARAKRHLANLRILMSAVAPLATVGDIVSKIDETEKEIESISSQNQEPINQNNGSSTQTFKTLTLELKELINQKNISAMMASIAESIGSDIKSALDWISSIN